MVCKSKKDLFKSKQIDSKAILTSKEALEIYLTKCCLLIALTAV